MISFVLTNIFIYACCAIGLFWAFFNYLEVKKIDLNEGAAGDYTALSDDGNRKKIEEMLKIGAFIARGANAFLYQEYRIVAIFCALMTIAIKFTVDGVNSDFGTCIAFVCGCVTSVLSGFIGMRVAVFSNYRVAYKCQSSLAEGFRVAFRAGCVMGFALTSLSLLVLNSLILIYRNTYTNLADDEDMAHLYEAIAGYGLGGSTIALFGRVGGGIYTKAADVGADLVGKLEQDLPEDSPKNPATIADNVGDNVGDIAGMGSDLFGSFAESTCASLVVLANAPGQRAYASTFACVGEAPLCSDGDVYLFYPLLLSAFAIIACLFCSLAASSIMKVNQFDEVEKTLRYQLIISAILLSFTLYVAALLGLDAGGAENTDGYDNFVIPVEQIGSGAGAATVTYYSLSVINAYLCTFSGLIVGLLIGLLTEYYTSNAYTPVQEVAESCKTGAATNIIYGLALGYLSCIIPVILLSIAAYISHKLLGLFGIALAALGMLSNLCVGLAVDAYGPISDNAGGIAEMSELGEETRHRTDALDAAGNTTAAIGKGFAIGSAAFVSLSLYGAFITRASKLPLGAGNDESFVISDVQVTDALLFSGLLIGAMLPYAFSAMTMKSVGKAALEMVFEIRKQLAENPRIKTGEDYPNYERCVAISTQASLKEMIGPGALVICTPLLIGLFFGPRAVAGLLPGALVSGVQMAISSSNTGGAWDNAKKYIESGKLKDGDVVKKKGSDEHKAAVIGDTVGDPLKDTSGPSLNILVKLSAILSLVFAPFFQNTGILVCALHENPDTTTLPPGARYCDYQAPTARLGVA
jgi:inorganic pyrophosphatase